MLQHINRLIIINNNHNVINPLRKLTNLIYSLNDHWWNNQIGDNGLPSNELLFPTKVMLIVTELNEAIEAHRTDMLDDKLHDRHGMEVELADAVIRIFDLCGAYKLDLGGAVYDKLLYNTERNDHTEEERAKAHGKKY
jgi:hypothetical protein